MIAFVSEDNSCVLKLFKARHRKKATLSRTLAYMKRSKADWQISQNTWKQKYQKTTHCYQMAFSHLQEETGLIFLHFEKTQTPLLVTLLDKAIYRIDISSLPFLLQRKAELAPSYFKRLQQQNAPEKLMEAKQALKDLFTRRIAKGFTDPRQTLSINYGFIGDKPIQIDVGKIAPFTGDKAEELKKIHDHIESWIDTLKF